MARPIRILVSSCLLGEAVRYDGGHKRDDLILRTIGPFVEWVPVCPEVDCGLPTPREAMRLVASSDGPRLVALKTGVDHTDRMLRWARARLRELDSLNLCGYICKRNSPSSGMARVPVYDEAGIRAGTGAGIFTRAFMDRYPLVPVMEAWSLHDPVLRGKFLDRVFVYRGFRDLLGREGLRRGGSR